MKSNTVYESVEELDIPDDKDFEILKDKIIYLTGKAAEDAGIANIKFRRTVVMITEVQQYSERKSISSERTFEHDTADIKMLNTLISAMAEKLAFDLRKKHKLTSCITIKIRYYNFDTHTLQKQIPYTSFNHTLIKIAKSYCTIIYPSYVNTSYRRKIFASGWWSTVIKYVRRHYRNDKFV